MERIISIAAVQDIVAGIAPALVVAGIAEDFVVAGVSGDGIVAIAAVDRSFPRPPETVSSPPLP